MKLLKTLVLFVLMFATLFAGTGIAADTRTERIVWWGVFLALIVFINSPPFWRWFRKKG